MFSIFAAVGRLLGGGPRQIVAQDNPREPAYNTPATGIMPKPIKDKDRIVPKELWELLSTEAVQQYGGKFVNNKTLPKNQLAVMLFERQVTYGDLKEKDLKKICDEKGITPGSNKQVTAHRIHAHLNPRPKPTAEAAAAADPKKKALKPPRAEVKPKDWKQAVRLLTKMADKQEGPMTKEDCSLELHNWRVLEPHEAVYHIVSPLVGGKDHPRNYCVLPNFVPIDYQLNENKTKLHHVLVVRGLPKQMVLAALTHSVGEERAGTLLAVMQADAGISDKRSAPTPGAAPGASKRPKPTPSGSGVAAAASGADPGANEAGPSRPARSDGDAPAGCPQEEQAAGA